MGKSRDKKRRKEKPSSDWDKKDSKLEIGVEKDMMVSNWKVDHRLEEKEIGEERVEDEE